VEERLARDQLDAKPGRDLEPPGTLLPGKRARGIVRSWDLAAGRARDAEDEQTNTQCRGAVHRRVTPAIVGAWSFRFVALALIAMVRDERLAVRIEPRLRVVIGVVPSPSVSV
jgi:hypothetical protein